MKILICGLPGSGKTHLAERLSKQLPNCAWFNADKVRGDANDWDFTPEGRLRQAKRMKTFADFEVAEGRAVICDFVAPTEKLRIEFDADIVIWVATINASEYEDTNAMFEFPRRAHFTIRELLPDTEIKVIGEAIELARKNNERV
jgi:adenylylsulfate kinase